jgi:hypothetical protein
VNGVRCLGWILAVTQNEGGLVTTAAWFPIRLLLAGCGILASLGLSSASEELTSHQAVATKKCSASVTFVASQNVCPTAPIGFRIAVPECEHSSGSFDYQYMAVNEIRKATVHRSAHWSRGKKLWDQREQVPLACGEGIYEVMLVGTPRCTCSAP